ncbi:MAG: hypothetical protein C4288_10245 [Leptolyngbya sp. ERB_1_1]
MKQDFFWIGLGISATVAMFPIEGTPAVARLFDRGLSIAQNPPQVELQLIAKQKVVQKDTQGKKRVFWHLLTKDTTVQKGTSLRLQFVAKNISDQASENLVITRPIPKGTNYLIGTATQSSAELTYSIDGGNTFTANPLVQVTLPDGRTEMQSAPGNAYSHLRWTFAKSIAPKHGLEVAYDVIVR